MIIESGLVRFVIPDGARDSSLYSFRCDKSELVSLEHAVTTSDRELDGRLASVASWLEIALPNAAPLTRRVPVAMSALKDAWTLEIELPEVDCAYQGLLVGQLPSGGGVCLRVASTLENRRGPSLFENVVSTVELAGGSTQPVEGWTRRTGRGISFALPTEFAAPRSFAFSGEGWTLTISHGATSPPYLQAGDGVRELERGENELAFRLIQRSTREIRRRVSREPGPAVGPSGIIVTGEAMEHHLREAALGNVHGRDLHLRGDATPAGVAELNRVWTTLCDSLDLGDVR